MSEIRRIELTQRKVALSVRDTGTGSGPPVLLMHGWPGSSQCWEAVIANMAPGRRIIRPDLRGLGDSERAGDIRAFKKEELAKDILALMDVLEIHEFIAAGQDWGGIIAQELALTVPERVNKLVIMNINLINNQTGQRLGTEALQKSPRNPLWYWTFQQTPGLAESMLPGNEETWLRYFFQPMVPENTISEQSIQEYIRCYKIPNTPGAAANYYRAAPFDFKRWHKHREKFAMPAMLIYGRHDMFLVPEFYTDYEACFTSVERIDLEAGHFVQDESPGEVAAALDRFIA